MFFNKDANRLDHLHGFISHEPSHISLPKLNFGAGKLSKYEWHLGSYSNSWLKTWTENNTSSTFHLFQTLRLCYHDFCPKWAKFVNKMSDFSMTRNPIYSKCPNSEGNFSMVKETLDCGARFARPLWSVARTVGVIFSRVSKSLWWYSGGNEACNIPNSSQGHNSDYIFCKRDKAFKRCQVTSMDKFEYFTFSPHFIS